MYRKIITTLFLSQSLFIMAQNKLWDKVTNWEDYIIEDEIGTVFEYAFYDIDGDGTNEALVHGYDGYALLTCGSGNIECALTAPGDWSMTIAKGLNFATVEGGCGSGCYYTAHTRIEKSRETMTIIDTATYGPNSEEHECTMIKNNTPINISIDLFKQLAPKAKEHILMEDINWKPVDGVVKPGPSATLHYQNGDTTIIKDSNGYLYQLLSNGELGVAPGGDYSGDIMIPEMIYYNNRVYRVTSVRRGAMWKKKGATNIGIIKSVTLPQSVTIVGADAFRDNASLTSVDFLKDTNIEVRAFWGCPNIQTKAIEPMFCFTEPFYSEDEDIEQSIYHINRIYLPTDEKLIKYTPYTWAFFKYNHNSVRFSEWANFENENAMECYCGRPHNIKSALYNFRDPNCIPTMFKGYLSNGGTIILLAENNYVATHEFPMFSRWIFGETAKSMPQSFIKTMENKYGRKVKYSYEAAKLLYSTNEMLVITEFKIENHEAMAILSWLKDGKEVCSYKLTSQIESEFEDSSVWNVDDDGDYGIPSVISIARDEHGNIELFLNHPAPESMNCYHLVQKGNKFIEVNREQWYVWIDSPE